MSNKSVFFGFSTLLIIFVTLSTNSLGTDYEDRMLKNIEKFEIKDSSPDEAIFALMKDYRIRICLEDDLTNKDRDKKKISLKIQNTTVKDALDLFLSQDTSRVLITDENGVMNLLPIDKKSNKPSSKLDILIDKIKYTSVDFLALLTKPENIQKSKTTSISQLLLDHKIMFYSVGGTFMYDALHEKIDIESDTPLTIRQILNRAAFKTKTGLYWHLTDGIVDGKQGLTFGRTY